MANSGSIERIHVRSGYQMSTFTHFLGLFQKLFFALSLPFFESSAINRDVNNQSALHLWLSEKLCGHKSVGRLVCWWVGVFLGFRFSI